MAAAQEWMSITLSDDRAPRSGWARLSADAEGLPELLKPQSTTNLSPPDLAKPTAMRMHWLAAAILDGPNHFTPQNLSDVISDLDSRLTAGEFELLGDALRFLPVVLVSPQVLLTAIRITSPARQRIPRWNRVLEQVATSLTKRNLDANRLLRGLL